MGCIVEQRGNHHDIGPPRCVLSFIEHRATRNADLIRLGWVDTDMGNATTDWMAEHYPAVKQISRVQSAAGCLSVLREAKLEDAVSFYNWDGSRLPW